jgi:hypothetical protein
MPAPRETIDAAVAQVAAYCERRSRDDYKIDHTVRGASITIVERRPPWNPAYGSEWSSLNVAHLRYDETAQRWRLFSFGSDDRWHPYEPAPSVPEVGPLLAALEEDRTGIFWG